MTKKRALGKGLSALLQDSSTDITTTSTFKEERVAGAIANIPIELIEANPFQPRTHFEEEALEELSASIKNHGIIQPVTVRKMGYDRYQLISGERRFRASQLAGLSEIPAYIRVANDQAMLEMALVENIQRQDLDAIEVAISYQRLIDECKLTQEELSEKVGKKRSTVSNYLRLLKLPAEIQLGIRQGLISMGHARALINLPDEEKQLAVYNHLIENKLSVRDVEGIVKEKQTETKKRKPAPVSLNFFHRKIKDELTKVLGSKVDLKMNDKGKGKVIIDIKNEGELQELIKRLGL
jgi:ParB family transcriptional regulator, chromosome partitioning protein